MVHEMEGRRPGGCWRPAGILSFTPDKYALYGAIQTVMRLWIKQMLWIFPWTMHEAEL